VASTAGAHSSLTAGKKKKKDRRKIRRGRGKATAAREVPSAISPTGEKKKEREKKEQE